MILWNRCEYVLYWYHCLKNQFVLRWMCYLVLFDYLSWKSFFYHQNIFSGMETIRQCTISDMHLRNTSDQSNQKAFANELRKKYKYIVDHILIPCTRAVYCASFFDMIRYDTICLVAISDILDEQFVHGTHGTLVINRFCHMRGAFGWLGDKFIMSLVMDSDICFPTECCNSLEHK